jgi:hypothetical protein
MGNFGTHTHSERNRQQQQQQKKKQQPENTSGAMGSRRERLPSETKKGTRRKRKKYQNGRLDIIETDFFFLSLSWFFFPFVLSVETRR